MRYSVIRIGDRQYKVGEGDEILADGFGVKDPEVEVLLAVDDDKVKIGDPVVKGAKVVFKVVNEEKGEKLYVSKYKAKSRYRKRVGFRSQNTRLQVQSIG